MISRSQTNKIFHIILIFKTKLFLAFYKSFLKKCNSNIVYGKRFVFNWDKFKIGSDSQVIIADKVLISGKLIVGNNCKIHIGNNVKIINYNIYLGDNSELTIKENVLIEAVKGEKGEIFIKSGKVLFNEFSFFRANLYIRFGGEINIGKYTGFSNGSEIVCDEKIEIGDFCMFSYNLNIFDTNSHSTNWEKRRFSLMNKGREVECPFTKPIHIGNDVWVGKNASILKGAIIEDRCIVGIGAIVNAGVYPADSIIVSEPSKIIVKQK